MESLRKLDSVIEYDYVIDTHNNVSTVLFFLPYTPFRYKRNTVNIDSFYIASDAAYKKAKEYADKLCALGLECNPNPRTDLKAAAERCGCGRGRNTLIYRKNGGSRFAIGAVEMKDVLPPKKDDGIDMPCLNCRLCQSACPVAAISDTFDRSRCMREYMQKPEKADEKILNAFECRLLGCDICQTVCPLNSGEYAEAQENVRDLFDIDNLYKLIKENKLDNFAENFGANYAVKNTLLSMLLIIAGNSGDKRYSGIAKENLNSASGRVRFAAEYALRKLGCG